MSGSDDMNFSPDHPDDVVVTEAEHVTQAIIDEAVEITDGWYADSPIDWEDVWDRFERRGYDFGSEMNSPAMRKIKREVRKVRAS